jgi:CubicO group peptidase (beta-lactamase class C family)
MGPAGVLQNQGWVAPALNRTADGSLYSTVLDLARWDQALAAGTVLTHAELARAWTVDPLTGGEPPLLHYGYGWEINSLRGHPVIEYDGNWQGFQSAMARYEDRHLTVAVLTNRSLCRVQRIVHTVAGFFDPEVAHFKTASDDPRPALTREFRRLIDDAQRGEMQSAPLSAAAKRNLSRGWLLALARDLRETGPIERLQFSEQRRTSVGLERVYRLDTREMVDFFTVRYLKGGLIDEVALYHEY